MAGGGYQTGLEHIPFYRHSLREKPLKPPRRLQLYINQD